MSVAPDIAAVGTWMPVRLGLVPNDDAALDAWRTAHRACVSHLRHCRDCGIELCQDGQGLWDAADLAEAALPWRIR